MDNDCGEMYIARMILMMISITMLIAMATSITMLIAMATQERYIAISTSKTISMMPAKTLYYPERK